MVERADKIAHKLIGFGFVDANAVLDGHWQAHSVLHSLHAISHQRRFRHQTRAKCTALYALGRTTAVQIDFVITPLLCEFCASGQIGGL